MAGKRPLSDPTDDGPARRVRRRTGDGSDSGSPTPKAKVQTGPSSGSASGSQTPKAAPPAQGHPILSQSPVPAVPVVLSKDEWDALPKRDRRKKRHEAWMDRSKKWQGFEGVWKGIKVLGAGTFGIAGLFEYVGKDDKKPRHMVVKQSGPTHRDELLQESRMFKQLNTSNSTHIVGKMSFQPMMSGAFQPIGLQYRYLI